MVQLQVIILISSKKTTKYCRVKKLLGLLLTHLFYVHNLRYFDLVTQHKVNTLSGFVLNSYKFSSLSPTQDRPMWGWVVGLLTMTNSKGGGWVKKSVSSCLDDNFLLSLPESFRKVTLILKVNRVSKYRPSFKIIFSLILLIAKY